MAERTTGKRALGSEILRDLPTDERSLLASKLESITLRLHDVLHEPGALMKFGYFVESGIVSILTVLSDGKSLEVRLVGREGFVGLPAAMGFRSSPTRAICREPGAALRISASALVEILPQCPKLEKAFDRYSLILGMQASQIAACNGLHEVDARLARWVLMCHDRLGLDSVPLTQEFLSQMLGVRRASVTVAAGHLQSEADPLCEWRGDYPEQERFGRHGLRMLRLHQSPNRALATRPSVKAVR